MFNYENYFRNIIQGIKNEGRYRVFIDILRKSKSFPNASWYEEGKAIPEDITVWCSNDYLGMGQHPFVIEAIERAMKEIGVGSGGTRNISGTNLYHVALENEISNIHEKEASLLFYLICRFLYSQKFQLLNHNIM